jgi:hypothetical protein
MEVRLQGSLLDGQLYGLDHVDLRGNRGREMEQSCFDLRRRSNGSEK